MIALHVDAQRLTDTKLEVEVRADITANRRQRASLLVGGLLHPVSMPTCGCDLQQQTRRLRLRKGRNRIRLRLPARRLEWALVPTGNTSLAEGPLFEERQVPGRIDVAVVTLLVGSREVVKEAKPPVITGDKVMPG